MEKYIGLDLGSKTLGIALSDSLGIVHPMENYNFSEFYYKKAREHLIEFIKKEGVFNIVFGLPKQLDDKEGKRCASVRRFASDLKIECENLTIFYQDESYSTIEARDRLKESGVKESKIKKIIDMMSATIILENFIRGINNGK